MITSKAIQALPNQSSVLPDPSVEPLPEAAEVWKNLPAQEQGILSHLAKSAEAFCTPEHLAKLGKTAEAIGFLLTKGLLAKTPSGVFHILDPLLKDIAGEASMHFEASGSVAEGGPKTFQFNFGMSANVRKMQPGH